MKDNPKAALSAMTTSGRLTLGKVAMLCRIESPILAGNIDDLNDTLAAIFVIESPIADSVENASRIKDAAVMAYDGISPDEYRRKVASALDEIASFFEMLPRPSSGSKKNSGTDGVRSSLNGYAEHTTTGRTTSSRNCRPSRPRSSGAAGSKVQEEASLERS